MSHADLAGKLGDIGALRFVRVEWWTEAPRFLLLRYEIEGQELPNGVRLDLDKKAILDSVGSDELDVEIQSKRVEIWTAAVNAQLSEMKPSGAAVFRPTVDFI